MLRGYDVCLPYAKIFYGLMYGTRGLAEYADEVKVFLNIVLDEAVEEKAGGEKVRIGMVVCLDPRSWL